MGISTEVVTILDYLLPGFVAAWVFYGLTGHPKQSPFERVVQALIFTIIVRALLAVVEQGTHFAVLSCGVLIDAWSEPARLVTSIIIALLVGHAIAWIANNNAYHRKLYKWRITTKTSLVSEWHSAFSSRDCYIILHLGDTMGNRKLFGWPLEWPDKPKEGHFVIIEPEWLTEEDGEYQRSPAEHDEMILVCAANVLMVEFVKPPSVETENAETKARRPAISSREGLQSDTVFYRWWTWLQSRSTSSRKTNPTSNSTKRGKK